MQLPKTGAKTGETWDIDAAKKKDIRLNVRLDSLGTETRGGLPSGKRSAIRSTATQQIELTMGIGQENLFTLDAVSIMNVSYWIYELTSSATSIGPGMLENMETAMLSAMIHATCIYRCKAYTKSLNDKVGSVTVD